MSYYEIEEVRNLKHSQMKSPTKRQKTADNVDMVPNDDHMSTAIVAVMHYLHALKTHLNSLAVAERTLGSLSVSTERGSVEPLCLHPTWINES